VAVTFMREVMATEQVKAIPLQAPDQPAKLDPAPGVAVRTTLDPTAKEELQKGLKTLAVQMMRPGDDVTLPLPTTVVVRSGVLVNVAVIGPALSGTTHCA
jgi:hypothetical protein